MKGKASSTLEKTSIRAQVDAWIAQTMASDVEPPQERDMRMAFIIGAIHGICLIDRYDPGSEDYERVLAEMLAYIKLYLSPGIGNPERN